VSEGKRKKNIERKKKEYLLLCVSHKLFNDQRQHKEKERKRKQNDPFKTVAVKRTKNKKTTELGGRPVTLFRSRRKH